MVKDVFYVSELFVQFNELDSRGTMVEVRSHTVCNPKLRNSHDEELVQILRVCDGGSWGTW